MELNFIPINIFRETPEVTFLDASVEDSNCIDVVIHRGGATSPPDLNSFENITYTIIKQIIIWCFREIGFSRY